MGERKEKMPLKKKKSLKNNQQKKAKTPNRNFL